MNTILLIGVIASLCYLSYRAGTVRDIELLEDIKEENLDHMSEARIAAAKLKSTREENQILQSKLQEIKAFQGMAWEYKGKPATSLAHVRFKDTSYLLMEPASAGLSPFLIRADNPDLKPGIFSGKVST